MHTTNKLIICMLAAVAIVAAACGSKSGTEPVITANRAGGNSLPAGYPDIGTLSVASYGADYLTVARDASSSSVSASAAGTGAVSMKAYIGINGSIAMNGSEVVNALCAPMDIASGSCTFRGLAADTSYRVIVIAENDRGMTAKYFNPVRAGLSEIRASDYLSMSDEEIGQLKWTLKIADDAIDDFSRIPSLDTNGIPLTGYFNIFFCAYRYSIAFNTYFLASVQYHKIPACSEIIRPRMDRLIQKMLHKKVWQYWALTSTGAYTFPFGTLSSINQLFYKSEHDPVKEKNIMYSGHLAQMIALYEKLYGDMKWSKPGSIVFKWDDDEEYVYDNNSLHRLLRDAFLNLPAHCIECEPNLCFAECNQHPILALKVYDQVHGTHYYDDVKDTLMNWFLEKDIIDPVSHNTSAVYLPLTDATLGPDKWDTGNIISLLLVPVTKLLNFRLAFAAADGWTMGFMHAWQPDFIRNIYPYNKQNRISAATGRLKLDVIWTQNLLLGMIADQLAIPLYAMFAGEMGDTAVRDRLIEQCNDLFDPVWNEDGSYNYPVGSIDTLIHVSPYYAANSVTGALVGLARSTPPNGLLKLHGEPVPGAGGPVVKNIDLNSIHLKRAVYDSSREVLVVSVDKGTYAAAGGKKTIKIDNIDKNRTWHLKIDGTEKTIVADASSIDVEVSLDGPHDIILAAE